MSRDHLKEIIESGDTERLVAVGLRAAFSDERCECAEPILTGLDLMCGHCLRENQGQIEKRTTALNSPHAFRPRERGLPEMCDFCSRWKDDPLHVT